MTFETVVYWATLAAMVGVFVAIAFLYVVLLKIRSLEELWRNTKVIIPPTNDDSKDGGGS